MTIYENKLSSYQKNQDAIISAKELEEWHLIGLLDHSIDISGNSQSVTNTTF